MFVLNNRTKGKQMKGQKTTRKKDKSRLKRTKINKKGRSVVQSGRVAFDLRLRREQRWFVAELRNE